MAADGCGSCSVPSCSSVGMPAMGNIHTFKNPPCSTLSNAQNTSASCADWEVVQQYDLWHIEGFRYVSATAEVVLIIRERQRMGWKLHSIKVKENMFRNRVEKNKIKKHYLEKIHTAYPHQVYPLQELSWWNEEWLPLTDIKKPMGQPVCPSRHGLLAWLYGLGRSQAPCSKGRLSHLVEPIYALLPCFHKGDTKSCSLEFVPSSHFTTERQRNSLNDKCKLN